MYHMYHMNSYRINTPEKSDSFLSNTYFQLLLTILVIVPIAYLLYVKFVKKNPDVKPTATVKPTVRGDKPSVYGTWVSDNGMTTITINNDNTLSFKNTNQEALSGKYFPNNKAICYGGLCNLIINNNPDTSNTLSFSIDPTNPNKAIVGLFGSTNPSIFNRK